MASSGSWRLSRSSTLSAVTAPSLELGLDERSWKPVHCAKRASAVRDMCGGCMGSFEPARAVLLEIVVLSTLYALIHASYTLRLADDVNTLAASVTHLAEAAISRPPLRFGQGASRLFAHQLQKMALAFDVDRISASAEPDGAATQDVGEDAAPPRSPEGCRRPRRHRVCRWPPAAMTGRPRQAHRQPSLAGDLTRSGVVQPLETR